eukprot:TRINITY_DN67663_c2_g1_i1.p1 TRINITY_DN67663_c2_g1~~TRINITY_DN67663_c2_g1_i1.p1  ORF type:complete len:571 (+),score=-0.27 TRINITY_DN67663_c2_g1_i1:89-1801(+)
MSAIIGENSEHPLTAVQACGAGVCLLSGAIVFGSALWGTIHDTTNEQQWSLFPIVTLWWMQILVPFLYIGARWRPLLGDAGFMTAALFLAQTPAWFYKYNKLYGLCVVGIFIGGVGYSLVAYQQKRKQVNAERRVYGAFCLLGLVPLVGLTTVYTLATLENAKADKGGTEPDAWLMLARETGYCGLQFPFLLVFSPLHNFLGIGTGCSGSLVVLFSWFGLALSGTALEISKSTTVIHWLPQTVLINGGWLCAAYLALEAIREYWDKTTGRQVLHNKEEEHQRREFVLRMVSGCVIGFLGVLWSVAMIIMLFVWEYDETLPLNAMIGGPIFLQLIMHIWFVIGVLTRSQTINATFWFNMYLNIFSIGSMVVFERVHGSTWFWKVMVLRISTICVMLAELIIDCLIVAYGSYIREKKFQRFPKFPASVYGILGTAGMATCLGLAIYVYHEQRYFQGFALAAIVGAGSVRSAMNTSFYGLPFTFFLVYCSNALMSNAASLGLWGPPTAYYVWWISAGAGTTVFLLLAFVKHAVQDVDKFNEATEDTLQDPLLSGNQAASYGGYQPQVPPYCQV